MIAASLFSGGKESIHAISNVQKQDVEVKHLLTEIPTFSTVHARNIDALRTLAKSMNKQFTIIDLHKGEQELVDALKTLKVDALVAGDINVPQHIPWLQNVCNKAGIKLLEPLYGKKTLTLFKEMFSEPRFKATIIGIKTEHLTDDWLGFTISSQTAEDFLSRTQHIDPLGENGEFHTIVVESPLYSSKFKIEPLEKVTENGLAFLHIRLTELE